MTTLPQTTNIRPPQAIGQPLPGLMPPITVSPGSASTMTGRDAWRVIRNNLWLIVLMVIVSGVGGYFLNMWWAKNWPVYTAKGLVVLQVRAMIDPLNDKWSDKSDTRVGLDQKSQAQLLTSDELFTKALTDTKYRQDIADTKLYGSFQKASGDFDLAAAKQYLRDNFRASAVADTDLISVAMECSDAKDAKTWLKAVVDTHLRIQSEIAGNRLEVQRTLLGDQAKKIQLDLATLRQQIAGARTKLDEMSKNAVIDEINLRTVTEAHMKVLGEAAEAAAMSKHLKDSIDRGEKVGEVERMLRSDPMMTQLNFRLKDAEIALNAKKAAGEGGENNVEYKRLLAIRDETQNAVKATESELRDQYMNNYRFMIEGAAAEKQASEANLRVQMGTLQERLKPVATEVERLHSLESQEAELIKGDRMVQDKILNVASIASAHAQDPVIWAVTPQEPENLTRPQLKWVLPIAIVLGLLVAVGIAFLREILDDTVRTPRDVSRVGHMNLLGMIADEADDPQAVDARLAIFDAPHSLTAEQFRQVRTRLQQASSLDQLRSVLVTGPSPMDGKTTVAANLAAGLALNGRKILLVDANFRRPELHRLFGFENACGFADVLNGAKPLAEAVQATRIPNLSVLTAGPKPANATELLESQLLADFIENAGQEYDHVIFDSGPLLIVSESAALASRVDGVITVIRAHAESRGLLQRMRDALRQLKAEHIGVVLNAVRSRGGGYYRRNIKAYYRYQNGA